MYHKKISRKWVSSGHFLLIYCSQKFNVCVDDQLNILSSFPSYVQEPHYTTLVKACMSMPAWNSAAATALLAVSTKSELQRKAYVHLCSSSKASRYLWLIMLHRRPLSFHSVSNACHRALRGSMTACPCWKLSLCFIYFYHLQSGFELVAQHDATQAEHGQWLRPELRNFCTDLMSCWINVLAQFIRLIIK